MAKIKKIKEIEPKIKEVKKEESELEEEIEEAESLEKERASAQASQEIASTSRFQAPILPQSSNTQETTLQKQTQERAALDATNRRREEIYSARSQQETRETYSSSQYTARDIAPILERRDAPVRIEPRQQINRGLTESRRIQRQGEEKQYETQTGTQTRRRRVWEGE